MANYEESTHYNGEAIVRFYPGMHGYFVTDPALNKKNARTGGGTSLTGTLNKGQGLMMWPMWEMSKYIKSYFGSATLQDLIDDPDTTIETILKAGRDAHVKKSDRGKSVGTDAHAWVESWCNYKMKGGEEPVVPEIEDIVKVLRTAYLRVVNDLKPKEIDEWKRLPKLIFKEIEIQEAMWTEASMVRRSIIAAKEWLAMHDIVVHGAEDTVYSRKLFVCGKYDGDWSVTCSKKCNWCYRNGDSNALAQILAGPGEDFTFTGRYVTDFKSTNASRDQPKGIYPEYLAQCAIYETAIIEEFPDRKYDGYLLLNGSKQPATDKDGNEYPVFNTHFSFNNEQYRQWASILAANKGFIKLAGEEMKKSNAGIKSTEKTTTK